MQNCTILAPSSLLNHLTTINLALELLEREPPLTSKQRALVQLALEAAHDVAAELTRS
jgi:hypothetical protein